MNFLESIGSALSSLWANKMRTFLTMLGIIIGIASVITIVSLGQGSQAQIGNEFEKMGANLVAIYTNWEEDLNRNDYFNDEDLKTVKRVFGDRITGVSVVLGTSGTASKGRNNGSVSLYGVSEDYNKMTPVDIISGRFLLESDIKAGRKVAIIDERLADKLFKRKDVLGENLIVDTGYSKISLTIIGIYETPSGTLENLAQQLMGDNTNIYVPYTMMRSLGYGDIYSQFQLNVVDSKEIDEVSKEVINVLERRHRVVGKNYYLYQSAQQQMDMMNNVLGMVASVIGAIAAISLLVGGIGVMNIMLVSVTERTREIGIRKSIGATRKDILVQFLVEAMIVSGTGGLIGTVLGLTIQGIISMSIGIPPSASLGTILIAVLFSAAVGIFFGIYPANKAAKLDPIEALRYE
ncbi:Macrolide export ATP-binding/permease protein macB [Proteiniborus sp. DW1]|uniref:ABC transporter permease n=1 Tax=Proteiniborus sp. DW1 TaxID=1889883 RepID=UPI00092DF303|nr:ABC transporter permease [Proteiniborus sp. DW1]SCG81972.1 Macrolide export ATP-binding/permease protein macB [Proteiniborus sp. DW1]